MLLRRLGMIIRGKATPFQLLAACVLGTTLGFMPGWKQAPGLMLVLTLLLIILNANLMVAALVGVGARLLSLAMAPVLFAIGRALLDGPAQGLFTGLINAPVFAWFGFENYTVTGGLAAGLVLGIVGGVVLVKLITSYRRKMADLEKNSERFKQWTSRRWVKLLTFLLVGGAPGKAGVYEQLLKKQVGNPIRGLGVVFVVVTVFLLVLLQGFARGPIVSAAVQSGLERVNGATVDLEQADLNLRAGRLTLTGLAMADPNRLETDLLRAATVEADVSASSLLRKRMQLDRVVVRGAVHGEQRSAPGRRTTRPPKEPEPEELPEDVKTLDDYLKDAAVWRDRLAQARRWIEKVSGPAKEQAPKPGEPAPKAETLEERLRRQVRELGYHQVRAEHLIQQSPTFTVSELLGEDIRVPQLPGETLRISGRHLSTHPGLLGEVPELEIASSGPTLGFALRLGEFGVAPGENTVVLHYHGLATDDVVGQLRLAGEKPLSGGTIDLDAQGTWTTQDGVTVDLPLQATLNQVTIALPGMQPTAVQRLAVPIGIQGPLAQPRIRVDDQGLVKALLDAGVRRATDELKTRAQKELDKQVGDKLGEQGGQLLRGLLDRKQP